MEELINILLIYGIMMFIINILSNNRYKKKHDNERINKKVIYEKKVTKNGQTTTVKRIYTDGNVEETIIENDDNFNQDKFAKEFNDKRQQMESFLEASPNKNNNRHSFMYQDVENEIIKVDHTFSKEVFLNNVKELFFKYYNSMSKGDCEELRKYVTENLFYNIQNKINENKVNNIKVVAEKIYIYNAFLYEFSKSTAYQVITVKLKVEMKNYEINEETQLVIKGNKYAKPIFNYEMQFERKPKDLKCQNCGAPVDTKKLAVCEYCNTPIEVQENEWKLNYINEIKED